MSDQEEGRPENARAKRIGAVLQPSNCNKGLDVACVGLVSKIQVLINDRGSKLGVVIGRVPSPVIRWAIKYKHEHY